LKETSVKTPSLVTACTLSFASACLVIFTTACQRASGGIAVPVELPVVPVVKATRNNLSLDLVLNAEFTPYQEVDVMAKVAGYLKDIRVDIGDHVHRGDLLATLEVPELQDESAKAAAAVAEAQANVLTAQGAVQRAEAEASIAHLSFERIENVATKHTASLVLPCLRHSEVCSARSCSTPTRISSRQTSSVQWMSCEL
jgi:multidrug efflux pump subunit AcrA (membrane-fusion protein)